MIVDRYAWAARFQFDDISGLETVMMFLQGLRNKTS